MTLNPEKYRFDESLKRFNFDVEHYPHREFTINDYDTNENMIRNYEGEFYMSPVRNTSRFSAQKNHLFRNLRKRWRTTFRETIWSVDESHEKDGSGQTKKKWKSSDNVKSLGPALSRSQEKVKEDYHNNVC